jgi:hypothetical protein
MAGIAGCGKLYELFTTMAHHPTLPFCIRRREGKMVGLALAMFVALFGWGARYFGWDDPAGKVQLALFTAFILGSVCGYKSKG